MKDSTRFMLAYVFAPMPKFVHYIALAILAYACWMQDGWWLVLAPGWYVFLYTARGQDYVMETWKQKPSE